MNNQNPTDKNTVISETKIDIRDSAKNLIEAIKEAEKNTPKAPVKK
ncbi:hypothetical protein N7603_03575 [Acholeplasma vituli]|uniref:Uncharacterized protein n=1 Tax=Paracholeplasma vituli TaxID=69473 RepID=A0ABT2PUV2_9MOLU|nr:hypothetical protein [Paracholeplasma vituli]MCU0104730.1 hypothetical protein [Paracholeplasma vituli]